MFAKLLSVFFGLILILALAWFVNEQSVKRTGKGLSFLSNLNLNLNHESSSPAILYSVIEPNTEIWQVDINHKFKKLFTDADEPAKVLRLSNLASQTKEVLAVTSETKKDQGNLVLINLVDAKETEIASNFKVPPVLALSQDGMKYAYTAATTSGNAYQYNLYFRDRSADIANSITSETPITALAWSPDGADIAYVSAEGENSIFHRYNLEKDTDQKIKTLENKAIDWISWTVPDKIISAVRKVNSNTGQIEFLNTATADEKYITVYSGGKANFAFQSPDESQIVYLVAQYQQTTDAKTVGQFYFYNLETEEKEAVEKGVQILGWSL